MAVAVAAADGEGQGDGEVFSCNALPFNVLVAFVLDISSHLGKRSYLPWEWEFPRRHIPPTLAATLGLDLPPWQLAPTSNSIDRSMQGYVTQHIPEGSLFCLPT